MIIICLVSIFTPHSF